MLGLFMNIAQSNLNAAREIENMVPAAHTLSLLNPQWEPVYRYDNAPSDPYSRGLTDATPALPQHYSPPVQTYRRGFMGPVPIDAQPIIPPPDYWKMRSYGY